MDGSPPDPLYSSTANYAVCPGGAMGGPNANDEVYAKPDASSHPAGWFQSVGTPKH